MLDDFLRAGERVEQLGDFAPGVVVDGVEVDLAEGTRTLAVVWWCEWSKSAMPEAYTGKMEQANRSPNRGI